MGTYIADEVINKALEIIEAEPVGIRAIAKRLNCDSSDLYRALNHNEIVSQRYAHAKEKQIEILVSEMDEDIRGLIEDIIANKHEPKIVGALVQAVKLKVDNTKWVAMKLKPKKYGERLEVSGTVQHSITHAVDLDSLPPADLRALLAIQAKVTSPGLPAPNAPGPQTQYIEHEDVSDAHEVKPLSVWDKSTRNDNLNNWVI